MKNKILQAVVLLALALVLIDSYLRGGFHVFATTFMLMVAGYLLGEYTAPNPPHSNE